MFRIDDTARNIELWMVKKQMNLNGEGEDIVMCGYISQPEGENSCGAYSLAYYLWATEQKPYSVETGRAVVDNIYKEIQFKGTDAEEAANRVNLNPEYSNPAAMVKYLNDRSLCAKMYMSGESFLNDIAMRLSINVDIKEDVLETLSTDIYVIIICSIGEPTQLQLHYMLVKKEGGAFQLMDSRNPEGGVCWKSFLRNPDQKITFGDMKSDYTYTGAGILIG
ncbi:hypothetical protein [Propionispira raffinosivorans]|uniref:hypothetical protein n=1 Tax=Propionispira raffinosivorans TaxID=86959 RepID=UPI00037642B0|nr:hypothetical protein [Propionispira raffinosivorans]